MTVLERNVTNTTQDTAIECPEGVSPAVMDPVAAAARNTSMPVS